MLFFWAFLFIFMVRLYRLQVLNAETVIVHNQYKLYALRDKLREAAMSKRIKPSNWVFQYLDSSIAKSIDALPSMTIWRIQFSPSPYRKDQRFKNARAHLRRELAKPSNQILAQVHLGYIDAWGNFFCDRHWLFRFLAVKIINTRAALRRRWNRKVELQTENPKTSTLQEYAPAA
jgi:hypothetical protein